MIYLSSEVPDETKIWRYMGFTKFVSFLEYGLYFCRADKFEDKFEGSLTVKDPELWISHLEDGKQFIPQEDIERFNQYIEYMKSLNSKNAEEMRKYVVINCWHMNENESEAMWKLYSQSSEGIAIQSTYARLKESIDFKSIRDEEIGQFVDVRPVKYIDYKKENTSLIPDRISAFLHKRKSFEHEKELRILISNKAAKTYRFEDVFESGKTVKVKYDKLIENIYIAPTLPKWFEDLVRDVLKKYGLEEIPIVRSTLDDPAIF